MDLGHVAPRADHPSIGKWRRPIECPPASSFASIFRFRRSYVAAGRVLRAFPSARRRTWFGGAAQPRSGSAKSARVKFGRVGGPNVSTAYATFSGACFLPRRISRSPIRRRSYEEATASRTRAISFNGAQAGGAEWQASLQFPLGRTRIHIRLLPHHRRRLLRIHRSAEEQEEAEGQVAVRQEFVSQRNRSPLARSLGLLGREIPQRAFKHLRVGVVILPLLKISGSLI
jgi:hypothetical protein